jgi:hypothetical protein
MNAGLVKIPVLMPIPLSALALINRYFALFNATATVFPRNLPSGISSNRSLFSAPKEFSVRITREL